MCKPVAIDDDESEEMIDRIIRDLERSGSAGDVFEKPTLRQRLGLWLIALGEKLL